MIKLVRLIIFEIDDILPYQPYQPLKKELSSSAVTLKMVFKYIWVVLKHGNNLGI